MVRPGFTLARLLAGWCLAVCSLSLSLSEYYEIDSSFLTPLLKLFMFRGCCFFLCRLVDRVARHAPKDRRRRPFGCRRQLTRTAREMENLFRSFFSSSFSFYFLYPSAIKPIGIHEFL